MLWFWWISINNYNRIYKKNEKANKKSKNPALDNLLKIEICKQCNGTGLY